MNSPSWMCYLELIRQLQEATSDFCWWMKPHQQEEELDRFLPSPFHTHHKPSPSRERHRLEALEEGSPQ